MVRPAFLLRPLLTLAIALWLAGCGSKTPSTPGGTPSRIVIQPDTVAVAESSQVQLRAQVQDALGKSLPVRVHWISLDTLVAQVDSAGVVTAGRQGSTRVEARTELLRGVAGVHVVPVEGGGLTELSVLPVSARFFAGDEQIFEYVARDELGNYLEAVVHWSVDRPDLAGIDSNTVFPDHVFLRCLSAGTVKLRVTSGRHSAEATVTISPASQVTTVAGSDLFGLQDGPVATAKFNRPAGLALDSLGAIYVTDFENNAIRVIENGQVRTLAGGSFGDANGTGAAAQFRGPIGIAVGPGRRVYVADRDNHAIRVVDAQGRVTTLAGTGDPGGVDSSLAASQFRYPTGVAVRADGVVFVADAGNHAIRKIEPGKVTTLCGVKGEEGAEDGLPGLLSSPASVTLAPDGSLYICEQGGSEVNLPHGIRRFVTGTGLARVAGGPRGSLNGPNLFGQFDQPSGVAVGPDGWLYVSDPGNNRVRSVSPEGYVFQLAGSDVNNLVEGPADQVRMAYPIGIQLQGDRLLVADLLENRVRAISAPFHFTTPVFRGTALERLLHLAVLEQAHRPRHKSVPGLQRLSSRTLSR